MTKDEITNIVYIAAITSAVSVVASTVVTLLITKASDKYQQLKERQLAEREAMVEQQAAHVEQAAVQVEHERRLLQATSGVGGYRCR